MKERRQVLIRDLVHLTELTNGKSQKFHIRLIGWLKSIKRIKFNAKLNRFSVLNEIDNTRQHLSPREMMDKRFTNIGEAINKKAFYSN
jgi:hypothetical protein